MWALPTAGGRTVGVSEFRIFVLFYILERKSSHTFRSSSLTNTSKCMRFPFSLVSKRILLFDKNVRNEYASCFVRFTEFQFLFIFSQLLFFQLHFWIWEFYKLICAILGFKVHRTIHGDSVLRVKILTNTVFQIFTEFVWVINDIR